MEEEECCCLRSGTEVCEQMANEAGNLSLGRYRYIDLVGSFSGDKIDVDSLS